MSTTKAAERKVRAPRGSAAKPKPAPAPAAAARDEMGAEDESAAEARRGKDKATAGAKNSRR